MNVNSLANKVLYLRFFVYEHDLSAIAVCEILLVPSVSSSFVSIEGFCVVCGELMVLSLLESLVVVCMLEIHFP